MCNYGFGQVKIGSRWVYGFSLHMFLRFDFDAATLTIGCAADRGNCKSLCRPLRRTETILSIGVSVKAPPLIFNSNQQIVGLEADFAVAAYPR